jgi:cysteine-rich repeat protein
MRRLNPAFAVLLAALLAPSAARATTADNLCAPAANPCTWSGNILVDPGSTLDFGARDLILTGSGIIRVNGTDTLTIKARRVTFQPGTGGRIRGNTTTASPTINIQTTEDIVFQRSGLSRGRIDIRSETTGGSINLVAGGNVDMAGEILAQGTTVDADGGLFSITATGNVTLNGDIDVSAGADAVGGDISVEAGGNVVAGTTTPEPLFDARGGLEGGSANLVAGPLLDLGGRVNVNGTGAGSDGGFITLGADGNVMIRSAVSADGSGSIDFGGFGGDVSITAGATLALNADLSIAGGSPDGEGGTLDCAAGLDYTQTGRILAQGAGDFAFGGTILLTAQRTATVSGLIDLHGGSSGGGGYLSIQTSNDIKAQSEINANGDGGYILLTTLMTTPSGAVVAGPVTVSGNIHSDGTATGIGGVNNIQACDITAVAAAQLATTGNSNAQNLLQASGKLTFRGKLDALPGGMNKIEYRDTTKLPDLAGATVTPAATQTLTTTLPACQAPPAAVCGNNTVEVGEACDGGNTTPCDGCSATCQIEACGNNVKECDELCDDGNLTDGDGCDSNCTPTGCGNGVVTSPEACDDGALNGTPASNCTVGCTIAGPARCGNNRIDPGETCDDNNTESCDGCSATCLIECGNGVKECSEQCDLGIANGTAGSSCSATCTLIGAPCLIDSDCDPAGRCGGHTCDTASGVCLTGPPLACDDGDACNGVETCSAGACVGGTAPAVDDHDSCTDDSCDAASGVVHRPKVGIDSASCRLDAVVGALATAAPADANAKAKAKIEALVSAIRAKLDAARTATGKKKGKMLKGAKTKLAKLGKAIRTAEKKKQLASGLAATLTTAVSGATSAVQTLIVTP